MLQFRFSIAVVSVVVPLLLCGGSYAATVPCSQTGGVISDPLTTGCATYAYESLVIRTNLVFNLSTMTPGYYITVESVFAGVSSSSNGSVSLNISGFSSLSAASTADPLSLRFSNVTGWFSVIMTGYFPPKSTLVFQQLNASPRSIILNGFYRCIVLPSVLVQSTIMLVDSRLNEATTSTSSSVGISAFNPSNSPSGSGVTLLQGSTLWISNITFVSDHYFVVLGDVIVSDTSLFLVNNSTATGLQDRALQFGKITVNVSSQFVVNNTIFSNSDHECFSTSTVTVTLNSLFGLGNSVWQTSSGDPAASLGDVRVNVESTFVVGEMTLYSQYDRCFDGGDLLLSDNSTGLIVNVYSRSSEEMRFDAVGVFGGSYLSFSNVDLTSSHDHEGSTSPGFEVRYSLDVANHSYLEFVNSTFAGTNDGMNIAYVTVSNFSYLLLHRVVASGAQRGLSLGDSSSIVVRMNSTLRVRNCTAKGTSDVGLFLGQSQLNVTQFSMLSVVSCAISSARSTGFQISSDVSILGFSWIHIRTNNITANYKSPALALDGTTTLDKNSRWSWLNNNVGGLGVCNAWTCKGDGVIVLRCNTFNVTKVISGTKNFSATLGPSLFVVSITCDTTPACSPVADCFTANVPPASINDSFACTSSCPCVSGITTSNCGLTPNVSAHGYTFSPVAPTPQNRGVRTQTPDMTRSTSDPTAHASRSETQSVSSDGTRTHSISLPTSASRTDSALGTPTQRPHWNPSLTRTQHRTTRSDSTTASLARPSPSHDTLSPSFTLSSPESSSLSAAGTVSIPTASASPILATISLKNASRTLTAAVPPQPQSSLTQATQSTTKAAVVSSVITTSPVSASNVARITAILSVISCELQLDVSEAVDLLSFQFGPTEGQSARGAVVGNVSLLIAYFIVILFLAWGVTLLRRFGVLRPPSHRAAGRGTVSFVDGLDTVHFPSCLATPIAAILQPTLTSAVALMFLNARSSDLALGAGVFVIVALYAGWTCKFIFFDFCCVLEPRVEYRDRLSRIQASSAARAVLYRLLAPVKKWATVDEHQKQWKRKHLLFFEDIRSVWYVPLELLVSIASGVVSGIPKSTAAVCLGQAVTFFTVYLVLFVAIIARPFLTPFSLVINGLTSALGLVASVILLTHSINSDLITNPSTGIQYCALLMTALGLLRTAADFLLGFVALARYRRKAMAHRAKLLIRDRGSSDDTEGHSVQLLTLSEQLAVDTEDPLTGRPLIAELDREDELLSGGTQSDAILLENLVVDLKEEEEQQPVVVQPVVEEEAATPDPDPSNRSPESTQQHELPELVMNDSERNGIFEDLAAKGKQAQRARGLSILSGSGDSARDALLAAYVAEDLE